MNKIDDNMLNENDYIEIVWAEHDDNDVSRRGAMYCFKTCDKNQN